MSDLLSCDATIAAASAPGTAPPRDSRHRSATTVDRRSVVVEGRNVHQKSRTRTWYRSATAGERGALFEEVSFEDLVNGIDAVFSHCRSFSARSSVGATKRPSGGARTSSPKLSEVCAPALSGFGPSLTPAAGWLDRLLQRTCHNTATVPPHRAAHGNEQARMLPEHSAATFHGPQWKNGRWHVCVCSVCRVARSEDVPSSVELRWRPG